MISQLQLSIIIHLFLLIQSCISYCNIIKYNNLLSVDLVECYWFIIAVIFILSQSHYKYTEIILIFSNIILYIYALNCFINLVFIFCFYP